MYLHHWTSTPLVRCMVQALGSENQGNIWACPGCSWRSCCGLCGYRPLWYIAHTSYNTNQTVGWHIHTCIIVLGPLHYCRGPWFKLMGPSTRVTADDVRGVVGGHDEVCGVIHPCQMWSIPHVTLIKQCDIISIPVSSSLGHSRTDKVNYAGSFVWKPG